MRDESTSNTPSNFKAPSQSRFVHRERWMALMIVPVCMSLYLANGDLLPGNDVRATVYQSSNWIKHRSLTFSPRHYPFMFQPHRGVIAPKYYLHPTSDPHRFGNVFGVAPGLMALPFVAVVHGIVGDVETQPMLLWMTCKFAASFYVALSVAFLFLCAFALTNRRDIALLSALIYGVCTCMWSIGSQLLWQHSVSSCFVLMGMWFFLTRRSRRDVLLSGIALGIATLCRPTYALLIIGVLILLMAFDRRSLVAFIVGIIPWALLGMMYNYAVLGSFWMTGQGYRALHPLSSMSGFQQGNFLEGLLGLLVSPSRGLFVYSPIMIVACVGIARIKMSSKLRDLFVVFASMMMLWILGASWSDWWGGWTFGYRRLLDALPLLALFLPLGLEIFSITCLRKCFVAALCIYSFGVQVIGAWLYNGQDWNAKMIAFAMTFPDGKRIVIDDYDEAMRLVKEQGAKGTITYANIDLPEYHHRLWSVRDSQLVYYVKHARFARMRKHVIAAREIDVVSK